MRAAKRFGVSLIGASLALLVFASCGGDSLVASFCDGLARDKCRATSGCFLDYSGQPDGYLCRLAKDDCERLTSSGGQSACESNSSCTWSPGSCYCPADMNCFCGGGPPPMCRAK